MTSAVITSYARTGITKAGRGPFNATLVPTLVAHAIRHCVERTNAEPEAVRGVVLGNVAHNGNNPTRLAGLLAGLPVARAVPRSFASVHRGSMPLPCHNGGA